MKREIYSHQLEIDNRGPYSLKEFNKLVTTTFGKEVNTWAHNNYELTRFEIEFSSESGYNYNESSLQLTMYRMETDNELEKRVKHEESLRLSREKQKVTKVLNDEKKKLAKEALLKNPDYQHFLLLQKKFIK